VEVTIGMAVVGIVFVALYSGLTSGIASVSMARENARATQIMAEKLDSIRLYSWDKITELGFTSTAFTAPFIPSASSDTPSELKYSGRVTLGTAPVDNAYKTNMRQLTVSLSWETGSVKRQRSMTTLIAKDGMQNYIY
jgi:hypothetical protein